MQRRAFWSVSLLTAGALFSAACNDLGTCDDPARGRSTIKYGSKGVIYTGQAILLTSCANNVCHSSVAKGDARKGAPEGLDFDLRPISDPAPGPVVMGPDGGIVAVQVDALQVAGLRARQRKVFDEREDIWEQVERGLMPPDDAFENLAQVFRTMFSADGACPMGMPLGTLDNAKEELRKWLACGTPIVEASSSLLPFAQPAASAGPEERAAGAAAYAGATGYQYPECAGGSGGDGGTAPSFTDIYNGILAGPSYGCLGCHGTGIAMGGFDIGTIDKAYTTLLGANGQGGATTCTTNPAPFVRPSDPTNSYLVTKLGGSGALCGDRMPLGMNGISASDLDQLRQWIMAGAMR
jgi:hypothetical protein